MKIKNQRLKKVGGFMIKHGPAISVGIGITGHLTALYLTHKASLKHADLMDDVMQDIEVIRGERPEEDSEEMVVYGRKLRRGWIKGGARIAANYSIPAAVEIASDILIGIGFGKMSMRHSAALAALALSENQVMRIRENICKKYGKEAEQEIVYGLKDTVTEVPILDKNGDPKIDKDGNLKTKHVHTRELEENIDSYSTYARLFGYDHTKCAERIADAPHYNNYEYNVTYVRNQISNLCLAATYSVPQVVFMNDILRSLGYPMVQEAVDVGWPIDDHGAGVEYDIIPYGDNNEFIIDFTGYRNVYELLE